MGVAGINVAVDVEASIYVPTLLIRRIVTRSSIENSRLIVVHIFCIISTHLLYHQYKTLVLAVQNFCTSCTDISNTTGIEE